MRSVVYGFLLFTWIPQIRRPDGRFVTRDLADASGLKRLRTDCLPGAQVECLYEYGKTHGEVHVFLGDMLANAVSNEGDPDQ